MSQGSFSIIRSDTPLEEKTWIENWSDHLLYSDLDWQKIPEFSILCQTFKQAFTSGGYVPIGKWRVGVSKGYYKLLFIGSGFYIQMNRNPKNLLEIFYSENDAVIEMLQIMACGQAVTDLFDLIRNVLYPPKPKQQIYSAEEYKLAALKRQCFCGGGDNGVTHIEECYWLPETIRNFKALEAKSFEKIKTILNWFDIEELNEAKLAAALEAYETYQDGWHASWGELNYAVHLGVCSNATNVERIKR